MRAPSPNSAAPYGYTIPSVNSSHAINPSLYARLPYNSVRDFGREPATTDEAKEIFGIRR